MSFCPSCRYEYVVGVARCPDCGIDLVEALPEAASSPDVHFVPLPSLPGGVYAEMVREVLRQEGIPNYLQSDGVVDTFRIVGTGPHHAGVRIFVPEMEYERAVRIQERLVDHV